MNTLISDIAKAAHFFTPWTGEFDQARLEELLSQELSTEEGTRVILPETIVHIISGNTPHAAWQTLLNGLLLGSKNYLKLPSDGLLDLELQLESLPEALRELIETSRELPEHWIPEAEALVVYGSDMTIRHFRDLAPLEIPLISHGHRFGIALIDDASEEAARLVARDIGEFDQNGCLSVQTIFHENPQLFAPLLVRAMSQFERENPRGVIGPSEHGAITNLRHEIRFLSAQDPEKFALWQSENSTAWTIIYEDSQGINLSPGNRTVFLKPRRCFVNSSHLSGIGLYPYRERNDLPSPRVFPLGQAQHPPFGWAHDGIQPLRSLVKLQTV